MVRRGSSKEAQGGSSQPVPCSQRPLRYGRASVVQSGCRRARPALPHLRNRRHTQPEALQTAGSWVPGAFPNGKELSFGRSTISGARGLTVRPPTPVGLVFSAFGESL